VVMLTTPVVADPTIRADESPEWERILRHWYIESDVMLALAAVVFIYGHFTSNRSIGSLAIELGSVAVITIAYFGIGKLALRFHDQRLGLQYLAMAIPAVGLSLSQGGFGIFLAVAVFVDIWLMLTSRRLAITVSVFWAIMVLLGASAGSGYDIREFERILSQVLLIYVVSVGLGLWVSRVARWQQRDSELIAQLRVAHDEIAAAHHEAGVVAERERLAGEIHDTLAQGFTSVITLAQAAKAALDRGHTDKAGKALFVVEQVARENLAEARSLIAASAPTPLQGNTISQALHRLGERWAAETGIPVTVATDSRSAPSAEQEVIILRAAQESLANIRKHANAHKVKVALGRHGHDGKVDAVCLVVTDDGTGIPEDVVVGFGFQGMMERLKGAAGELEVSRISPEGGTKVQVLLPVNSDNNEPVPDDVEPLIVTYDNKQLADVD